MQGRNGVSVIPQHQELKEKKLENAENWECVGSYDVSKLRI